MFNIISNQGNMNQNPNELSLYIFCLRMQQKYYLNVIKIEIYLTELGARKLKTKVQADLVPEKASALFLCPHRLKVVIYLSGFSFIRALIPFRRAGLPWSNHSEMSSLPNIITLVATISTYGSGGNTNIQIALIRRSDNKYWWGSRETGIIIYFLWEHKMLQIL